MLLREFWRLPIFLAAVGAVSTAVAGESESEPQVIVEGRFVFGGQQLLALTLTGEPSRMAWVKAGQVIGTYRVEEVDGSQLRIIDESGAIVETTARQLPGGEIRCERDVKSSPELIRWANSRANPMLSVCLQLPEEAKRRNGWEAFPENEKGRLYAWFLRYGWRVQVTSSGGVIRVDGYTPIYHDLVSAVQAQRLARFAKSLPANRQEEFGQLFPAVSVLRPPSELPVLYEQRGVFIRSLSPERRTEFYDCFDYTKEFAVQEGLAESDLLALDEQNTARRAEEAKQEYLRRAGQRAAPASEREVVASKDMVAWINSSENPMYYQPQPVTMDFGPNWTRFKPGEKARIEAWYLSHGWRLDHTVESGSDVVEFAFEGVFTRMREEILRTRVANFLATLSSSQRELHDEMLKPLLDLAEKKAKTSAFNDALSVDQRAQLQKLDDIKDIADEIARRVEERNDVTP